MKKGLVPSSLQGNPASFRISTLKSCVKAITDSGLKVHKEQSGYGVSASLGMEITKGSPRLRSLMKKQSSIAAATREFVRRGKASGKELEVLLGSWVWLLLP